ncbi:MAG: CARDB domain-containing protein, partial [Bdellovibrio sp.]
MKVFKLDTLKDAATCFRKNKIVTVVFLLVSLLITTAAKASAPDVVVTSVSYSADTGLFTSVVKNQGDAATPSGVVIGNAFYVDGKYVAWGNVSGPLAPGASVTIDSSRCCTYQMSTGTHTIMVWADDVNRFAESNENNNQLSQTVSIGLPPMPDVIVTSVSYSAATGLFTSVVKNQGNAPTPSGVVIGNAFYVDGKYVAWGNVSGSLAAGASVTIDSSLCCTYQMSSGAHTIMAYADDVNRFAESDENNNKLSQAVYIGVPPAPDVIVTSVSYSAATGLFTSVVKNQGNAATPAGVVIGNAFYVDGKYVAWGSVPGPLAPGASVTIDSSLCCTYQMSSGTHTIMAYADDVNRFAESDETNNQLSQSVTIGPITPPPSFIAPALVNPVNPMNYGAKCDGVTDDSAAFQAAVDAGDVLIPAKTCLINHTVYVSTSNKHIECAQGAVLQHTNPYAGNMFRIIAYSAPISDISIVNCHFIGTNTVAPQYFEADARHWDIPVESMNTVNNIYIAGNTFERFFGQSMFQTYSGVYAGSGTRVEYNTFKSCGYYGPVLTAATNSYIGHNTMIDCATGVENDNSTQATGGNIIEYNTLTAVNGYGAPDMNASVLITGGGAGGANYSGNIVRYNTVSGVGSAARGSLPSMIYEPNPAGAAQYIG